jgi:hypothetical protein
VRADPSYIVPIAQPDGRELDQAIQLRNPQSVRLRCKVLLSDDPFSVDGTLIEAWASMKSFRPKDGSGEPPAPGRNSERDFHGEKRRNETHASTTDPDVRLYRKGPGQPAKLAYLGHVLMENRHALVVDAIETGSVSGFLENPLDRLDWPVEYVGNLGDGHSVFHQGTNARRFLCRGVRCCGCLRCRRRVHRLLANRRRRQDRQYAWFARLSRQRRIGNRMIGNFRFRREEGLGGLACAHNLLAFITAKLALSLRAVDQELPRTG